MKFELIITETKDHVSIAGEGGDILEQLILTLTGHPLLLEILTDAVENTHKFIEAQPETAKEIQEWHKKKASKYVSVMTPIKNKDN